ncbi:Thioredoxin domain protein [Synechocystis sp. LKSZ1]
MNRVRNLVLALMAVILSGAIYFGFQTQGSATSLEAQSQQAIPLEVALSNGKPTLTEFYADWCTSCQTMAKDLAVIKRKYADQVNFAMLNVDNSKWLPEVLRYRVDGIPHFVFLNEAGEAIAQAIGEQPRTILEANLAALLQGLALPYARATGQVSALEAGFRPSPVADPRGHGG